MSSRYQVRWTPEAESDAASIVDWFDDAVNANKVLMMFEAKANSLARFPHRGRIIPELQRIGVLQFREIFRKPWRMMYFVDDEVVWILAVLDGRRNIQDLLYERLTRTADPNP